MSRVLVTASRLRLAALFAKGLPLQGGTTSVATNYSAVIEAIGQASTDGELVDADFFQGDTSSLVARIRQQHLSLFLLAEDYQVGGYDLRKMAAPEDIFIKPFSTQY